MKKLLDYDDLEERYGLARDTVQFWMRREKNPFPRPQYLGRRAVWETELIDAWIDDALTDDPPVTVGG